jgi:hypothetical protein
MGASRRHKVGDPRCSAVGFIYTPLFGLAFDRGLPGRSLLLHTHQPAQLVTTARLKQRHTAKRIFQRLRAEHGYAGGYTVVKDYVRLQRTRRKEAFVLLAHPPGHAQVDFGQCIGIIGSVRTVMHVFCFDLPHSDAPLVKAYPAETRAAQCDRRTYRAIAHPCGELTRQPGLDLDVKDLTTGTPLSAIDANALTVERIPGVRHHDKLRSVC